MHVQQKALQPLVGGGHLQVDVNGLHQQPGQVAGNVGGGEADDDDGEGHQEAALHRLPDYQRKEVKVEEEEEKEEKVVLGVD